MLFGLGSGSEESEMVRSDQKMERVKANRRAIGRERRTVVGMVLRAEESGVSKVEVVEKDSVLAILSSVSSTVVVVAADGENFPRHRGSSTSSVAVEMEWV